MTVISVDKDRESLAMTITTEHDAPVERVWQVWADPRQLERWWGPPTHPATVVDHDLRPGGRVSYYMTGPDGEKYHGWWRVLAVDSPRHLELEDGFADDEGEPVDDLPVTTTRVELSEAGDGRTRMAIHTRWGSIEAMEQNLEMGLEEGITLALGQIDPLLAGTR